MSRFYDPLTYYDTYPARNVVNCILTAEFMPAKLPKILAWERATGVKLTTIYAYTQEIAPYTKIDFYLVDKSCRESLYIWYHKLVSDQEDRYMGYATWCRDFYTQQSNPMIAVPRVEP